VSDDRRARFPPAFFDPSDGSEDTEFYRPARLVTHIDDGAIAAVGVLYRDLGIGTGSRGAVLDLMSSWVSHFLDRPQSLTVLGMNASELAANPMADATIVHDLNRQPTLPFADGTFSAAVCCVSVDYLTRPFEVFDEISRVLVPGSPFVCTFSNRCFPTKVIRGWLAVSEEQRCALVAEYFRQARRCGLDGGDEAPDRSRFTEPTVQRRTPPGHRGDPLYAVWATVVG
jgi:SAM-dependent methyltransferase